MTAAVVPDRRARRREKRFVKLFVLTLVIAFSPITALGQVSALIFLGGVIFFVGVRPIHHLKKYLLIIFLYSVAGLYYWLLLQGEFDFVSFFLFFVTMSSFLFLGFDFKPVVSEVLLGRLGSITLLVIGIESAYGIFQAVYMFMRVGSFDGSVGDFVWGTIAPPFNAAYAGRSPTFVVLISTLLLFSFAVSERRLAFSSVVAYSTVVVCWLLASLMHSLIFFAVAAVGAVVLLGRVRISKRFAAARQRRFRRRTYGIAFVLLTILLFAIVGPRILPNNFAKIPFVFSQIFDFGPDAKFFKSRAIYLTVFELPGDVWLQPIIGVGPGQYASRAALMVSGQYLARPLPFLPDHVGVYTERYILPLLGVIRSSLHIPSSSWLAVYGEIGLIGLLVAGVVIIRGIKVFRAYRAVRFARMNLAMLTLLLYVALLGVQNVYWEYTQAIFPAILCLKLCYDYLHREREELHLTTNQSGSTG